MIFEAFIDESIGSDGTFVLAGHIASPEAWAAFSAEWRKMLSLGVLTDHGDYHFKMSEMAAFEGRMERVSGFFRIIEKHVVHSISCRINTHELMRASQRIYVMGTSINWGPVLNPYFAAFRVLMDHFHARRADMLTDERLELSAAKIDFYFDERSDKKLVRRIWDDYIEMRPPDIRALYGNEPRFENDREFLPLQGADFWAWWIRRWCEEGSIEKRLRDLDFGRWKGKGPFSRSHINMDEEHWVKTLAELVSPQLPLGTPIYDLKSDLILVAGDH